MTMIYSWRRDFSHWSCYCSIDGMCGMPVCEWTQQELTLDIRFMGGDYDPGHSGRNREKDSKAKANRGDERWRETGRENGAKAMKWNEVFDLCRTGEVLPVECLIWCRAYERMNGHHQLYIMSTYNGKEGCSYSGIVIYVFICHTTIPSLSIRLAYEYFPIFFFKYFEKHTLKTSPKSTLFV